MLLIKSGRTPCGKNRNGQSAREGSGSQALPNPAIEVLEDYADAPWQIVRRGSRVALIGAGAMFGFTQKAADLLAEKGVEATLINPRRLSSLDTEALDSLKDYDIVITAEDGIIDGGFGQKVASYLGESPVKMLNLGLPKEFLNRYDYSELQRRCGLTPEQIAESALSAL